MSRTPRPPASTTSRSKAPEKGRGRTPARSFSESPARLPRGKRPAGAPESAPRFQEHEPQRIAKLLARAGVGSRRDIERMIEEGRIALDGAVLTTPATIVTTLAGVTVDGNPVAEVEPTRLWRFFKPAGCLTTVRDPAGRPTIFHLLPKDMPRVVSIGRLDYNTEGLLLLTNNGELKRWLELPANAVERIYRARVRGRIDYNALADLIEGITIDGVRYGSINAEVESSHGLTHWIAVKIREGKNREVRNVLGHLGLQVSRLIRTDYGPFTLDGLREGDVQEISPGSIPGVPGEMLPPAGFEVEDPRPRRREEIFAPRAANRSASARSPEAPAAPEPVVRPARRQTRAAEARAAEGRPPRTGTSARPGTSAAKPRGAALAATPEAARKKLERKAGWAKPKSKAGAKPRSGSKPGGRKK